MISLDRQFTKYLCCGIAMALLYVMSASAWAEDEDLSEAEVTIVQDDKDQRVEEYRVNGRLYLVKVIPVAGPSYLLVDRNGDGQFELTDDDPTASPPTAQWVLFKWN